MNATPVRRLPDPVPSDPGQDRLFAALANGTRREVLRLLREDGPQPVQQIAEHFAMRRPSLSEHLKVLRDAGLVSEERAGRQRIYRLEAAPLSEVQDWLSPYERFWRGRLAGLGELLDRIPDTPDTPDTSDTSEIPELPEIPDEETP
ncbi:ArsR/SmtB family transcription factor [Streptomyces chattanoogensis]|uniref:ArsR/SmtB family transcription factor n=1 Tax=Streptomyces chattanoogensis TaxID=66876 RepID=UPI00099D414A|nr:metalloregulator ArsR/SmtB family transcription factor [Streptomyces chattanoogensis]